MGIIDRWFGGKPAEDNHAIQAVDEDVLTIKDEKGDIIGVVFLFTPIAKSNSWVRMRVPRKCCSAR